MINIAVNCLSRSTRKPYKCPHLGDNIHLANLAYQVHKEKGEKVKLHFGVEKTSENRWKHILQMFPEGSIDKQFYQRGHMDDDEWVKWLQESAAVKDPQIFAYRDPESGAVGVAHDIVVDDAMSKPALLPAIEHCAEDYIKPEKYVVVQWDAQWIKRRLPEEQVSEIESYYKERGYKIVKVGGDADITCLRESLKHIGYAISNADYFVGLNSGMWHMAQLYLPYERISCWVQPQHVNAKDDHVKRFIKWGGKFNEFFD